MPIAKLKSSSTPDVMDAEEKIDTIIRQTIGRETSLSFPSVNDNSIHWIELFNALDSQGVNNSFSGFECSYLWRFIFKSI